MKRKKDSDSYIKFLSVIDIIIKHSDENHPLTVNDIKNLLYETDYDFDVDYRAIKKYIDYYNTYYNEDIMMSYKKGRNNYFYFTNKALDSMEAKAIVDLVYSSDFFTLKTKENYKKKIQNMFSVHYQAYFNKVLNPHLQKNENDHVFYEELETIAKAIHLQKKISFKYHKPSLSDSYEKEHTLAPIDSWFSNNVYYLLCQGARNKEDCILYRIDYINDVKITDEDFALTEYEVEQFKRKLQTITYMYSEGEEEVIELEFSEDVYSNMIDKFGKDIKPHPYNNNYRIQVKHTINSTFYSWIIGFGGKIQIVGNQKQVQRFEDFLTTRFIQKQ